MTASVNSAPAQNRSLFDLITDTLTRLKHLTEFAVQTQWRQCFADLPVSTATRSETWQDWAIAPLNARQHIAWDQGKQVLWLAQRLQVPQFSQGYPLAGLTLRLGLMWWAHHAAIYVNGILVQEGDIFDCSTRILLTPAAQPGEIFEIVLRLLSPGHDPGALVRSSCIYALPEDACCPEPGFVADELTVLQQYCNTFAPEKLPELWAAVQQIEWTAVGDRDRFQRSLQTLRDQLQPLATDLKQHHLGLLGHAHLDLAWLWPVEDTWQAAEHTFKSVLTLWEQFPDLIFCHSTPALYAWVEANRPELFRAIQAKIATQHWEVVAGLWVEPELNLINGESLVRHVLYGQRYVQQKLSQPIQQDEPFAANSNSLCRIAWLPDSFGFPWQLPQILKQGGVDYFVTQKLRWHDTTEFPYDWFTWQSPDGSQIFSLISAPIGEGIDPVKMATYAFNWQRSTHIPSSLWLPGVGDHGGGPTRDMLETAQRWQHSPFFPTLEFTTATAYLEALPSPAPLWNSELYLEFHRGCYTTHADQKRYNRQCERLLYQAELFATWATVLNQRSSRAFDYPQTELETAWKKVLFNQFHDILPGSAIPQVYVEANQDWLAVEQTGQRILQQALAAIAQHIALPAPPQPNSRPFVVFNALNWERSEVVAIPLPTDGPDTNWCVFDASGLLLPSQIQSGDGAIALLFQTPPIPGLGYSIFWLSSSSPPPPPPISQNSLEDKGNLSLTLENHFLRVTIDAATGDIAELFDKIQHRSVLEAPSRPFRQLQAFQDSGQYWDAWNIDPNYAQHPLPPACLQSITFLDQGEILSRLRVVRQLGRSHFIQDYVLEVNSPVLKIVTQVDWQEEHVLVKALFPLTSDPTTPVTHVTYETACGAIQRPLSSTDPHEQSKWEVPALQWADFGNEQFGVSLLNDGKHGYSAQSNDLSLTLLRSSTWPDPAADRGQHQFTYALYPHAGSWQAAQTVRRAYELNQPLMVKDWALLLGEIGESDRFQPLSPSLPPVSQFLNLASDNLILMACKQAETNQHWIFRFYECHGETAALKLDLAPETWGTTDYIWQVVNLLEQSTDALPKVSSGAYLIAPWKIVSFKLKEFQEVL